MNVYQGRPSYILGSMPLHAAPTGFYGAMPMVMRRRMIGNVDEGGGEIKKCVVMTTESVEICVSYFDGDVLVEFNEETVGEGELMQTGYFEEYRWIWKDVGQEVCDENVLKMLGYDVCVQRAGSGVFAVIKGSEKVVDRLDLMNGECDIVYERVDDGLYEKKLCEYMSMVRLCFEMTLDHQAMIITTQRKV